MKIIMKFSRICDSQFTIFGLKLYHELLVRIRINCFASGHKMQDTNAIIHKSQNLIILSQQRQIKCSYPMLAAEFADFSCLKLLST